MKETGAPIGSYHFRGDLEKLPGCEASCAKPQGGQVGRSQWQPPRPLGEVLPRNRPLAWGAPLSHASHATRQIFLVLGLDLLSAKSGASTEAGDRITPQ